MSVTFYAFGIRGEVMNTNKVILKPLFKKKSDPLTLLLKDIFKENKNAMSYLGALSIGLGFSEVNTVSAEDNIEEVIIDAGATKGTSQPIIVHTKNKSKTEKTSAA